MAVPFVCGIHIVPEATTLAFIVLSICTTLLALLYRSPLGTTFDAFIPEVFESCVLWGNDSSEVSAENCMLRQKGSQPVQK
eukprot:584239-Rhodomonas_salina.6